MVMGSWSDVNKHYLFEATWTFGRNRPFPWKDMYTPPSTSLKKSMYRCIAGIFTILRRILQRTAVCLKNIFFFNVKWLSCSQNLSMGLISMIPTPLDFPHKKSPSRGAYIFFVVSLKRLLNDYLSCWWFETLWRSCDVFVLKYSQKTAYKNTGSFPPLMLLFSWAKWSPFRRRYFQMHFLEWKVLYFD